MLIPPPNKAGPSLIAIRLQAAKLMRMCVENSTGYTNEEAQQTNALAVALIAMVNANGADPGRAAKAIGLMLNELCRTPQGEGQAAALLEIIVTTLNLAHANTGAPTGSIIQ